MAAATSDRLRTRLLHVLRQRALSIMQTNTSQSQVDPLPDLESDLPAVLAVGEVRPLTVGGEDIFAIGSEPSGFVVLLSAVDWVMLQRFKLTRLRVGRHGVRSASSRHSRSAGRFITGIDVRPDLDLLFRNGNPLDLRRTNVVVMSRSTIVNARRRNAVPWDIARFANGRKRPRNFISATEKIRAALYG